jgi:hypothetical protein
VVTELGLGSPVLERLAANDSDGIPGFSAHSHRFSNYYHYRRWSTLSLLTIHVEGDRSSSQPLDRASHLDSMDTLNTDALVMEIIILRFLVLSL